MQSRFPMFSCDGPTLSLDDEDIFHRLLSRFLPPEWGVHCFTDQNAFAVEIRRQLRLQENICSSLAAIINSWRTQEADLIAGLMTHWQAHRERPACLAMIDFRMPYSTGVDLLSSAPLRDWNGGKLLLTAHADDRVAVDAFNRGLISQFINKGALGESRDQVIALLASMRRMGNSQIESTWASQIGHEQQELISSIRAHIESVIEKEDWQDFAVIGRPFGVLGRKRDGSFRWMQLETQDSLISLVDMLENTGASGEDCLDVKNGKAIVCLEVDGASGKKSAAIEMGSEKKKVWGALFDVDPVS